MVSFVRTSVLSLALAFSMPVFAQDGTSSGSVGAFDYQGQTNLGLAPQTPEASEECLEGQSEATAADTTSSSSTLLNPSTELSATNNGCAALAAVAIGTAGYIETQTALSTGSGIGAAGALAGAVVLGGTVALLSDGGSTGGSDPIPFPIPGVGLLSYMAIGASGAFIWLRKRLRTAKDNIRQLAEANSLNEGAQRS